jgi:2',3'-cyclic-nucleotide 2'-phosphodiesterase (5'-nucleotidase family)
LKENREKFPGKPALQVEVGNFLQAVGNDRFVKNKWLWRGMEALGIDVLNVAEDDYDGLVALGAKLQNSDRFVSANLLSKETGEPVLKPYVIKSMPLPGTQKLFRVGFLGLSSRDSFLSQEGSSHIWADPLESANKWLPELREKCDFVTVLACMPSKDAVQLAINHSEVNIIINGFKHQYSSPPATINKSRIVYSEDEGRVLGELRFDVAKGPEINVYPINYFLTASVKDDPKMAEMVQQARQEISRVQAQAAEGPAVAKASIQSSDFVTAVPCAACHQGQYDAWSKTSHAHAIEILKQQRKEYDTTCVGCHVTGFRQPGGFVDLHETPQLANVQCEMCHGPGRLHSLKPVEARMLRAGPATCEQCHNPSRSPEFKFSAYWEKIKH